MQLKLNRRNHVSSFNFRFLTITQAKFSTISFSYFSFSFPEFSREPNRAFSKDLKNWRLSFLYFFVNKEKKSVHCRNPNTLTYFTFSVSILSETKGKKERERRPEEEETEQKEPLVRVVSLKNGEDQSSYSCQNHSP